MEVVKAALPRILSIVQMRFSLVSVLDYDDRVVLEVTSRADLPGGGVYDNCCVYVMTVRNGKIFNVREYDDTYSRDKLPPEVLAMFEEVVAAEDAGATW